MTLQFDLSRDIEGAANDVQAAINAARTLLPTGLPSNPTYRKVNPADAPIMILSMTSETMTQGQMYDAASTILAQKLSQVKGVGQVTVGRQFAAGGARGTQSGDALQVRDRPRGRARRDRGHQCEPSQRAWSRTTTHQWQILANDQARKAAEYIPIIVAFRNGAAVRLSDVAEVIDSVQDLRNAGSANGKPSVLMILNRQPNANIIETVDRVDRAAARAARFDPELDRPPGRP